MSSIKIKSGDSVTIEILHNKKSQNTSPSQQNELIKSKKEDEYLPRRLSNAAGIRFFDLGWKDGADLYISFLPEITGDPSSLQFLVDAITSEQEKELTDYIQSQILSVAPENWLTTFRKITKSSTWSKMITVYSYHPDNVTQYFEGGTLNSLGNFSGDALKLTSEEAEGLAIFPNGELFYPIFFYFREMEANIKITAVADIEAEEVSFSPSPLMDIFLTPAIVFNSGQTNYFNGENAYNYIQKIQLLNNFYSTFPREILKQLYDALGPEWWTLPNGYSDYYFTWSLLKQLSEARLFHGVEVTNESPAPPDRTYSEPSVSDFPFEEIYTPDGIEENATNIDNGYGFNLSVSTIASKLVMIIKKGNETFYFWHII